MNTEQSLLPCPFCENDALQLSEKAPWFYVVCEECDVSTRGYRHAENAIAAWNRRAPSDMEPTCNTCNGHGRVGGPTYYAPDEGGEPCPDCTIPPQLERQLAAPAELPLTDEWEQICEEAPGMKIYGEKGLFLKEEALQKVSTLLAQRAAPTAQSLSVKLAKMSESNGNVWWSVYLAKSDDAQLWDCHEVYNDTIKGRAEYEADSLKHFLGLGPRPDILAYDTDAPHAQGSGKDAQGIAKPIPKGIYYTEEHDNFYSIAGSGMGQLFYELWQERKGEFPKSFAAAAPQEAPQQEPVAWFCVNSVTGKMLYTDSRDESANMRDQKKGFWTVTPLFSGKPETPVAAPISTISAKVPE